MNKIENKNVFLKVENLSCIHHGKKILDSISFSVFSGEFVVIFGRNGSGKTTLAKHFNSLHIPDKGDVWIDGINTKEENEFDVKKKVSFVFQNPDNQIVAEKVEEDIAFALENLGIEREEIVRRVDYSLDFVDLIDKKKEYIYKLSGGNKQKLILASSLAINSKCLVLDESTSMLDYKNRNLILKNILKINKEKGITIILLTHNMDEFVFADRVLILDKAKIISEISDNDFMKSEFFSNIEIKCDFKKAHNVEEEEILSIENLSYKYPGVNDFLLKNIDFKIYRKEIIGIMGEIGSGKTTFINLIKGILKPTDGKILFNEKYVKSDSKIGMVFQTPEDQFFEETLIDEVMFGPKNLGFLNDDAFTLSSKYLKIMEINESEFKNSPFKFSGGQMRKIAIASVLSMNPEVLILDEPTSGLDCFSRQNILELIHDLNEKENKTVIVVSHSYEDLKKICSKIIFIKNNKINEL